jgi:hypothetical protein
MKTWTSIAICMLVSLALSPDAAWADETAGTVKTVRGDANIVRGGLSTKAYPGMKLLSGDQIVTGSGSSLGITLQDSTLMSFGPKSSSKLDEFSYDPVKRDGNLLVSLLKGTMRFVTGQLGRLHPRSVGIKTPSTILGIRGTDFILSVEGGK